MADFRHQYFLDQFFSSIPALIGIALSKDTLRPSTASPVADLANLFNDLVTSIGKKVFSVSDEDLMRHYLREWETIYSMFVSPLWRQLTKLKIADKTRKSKQEQITAAINFLITDPILVTLCPLLVSLNASLRNCLAHMNYYVDKGRPEIVSFTWDGKKKTPVGLPLKSFAETIVEMMIGRMMLLMVVGDKIVNQSMKPLTYMFKEIFA